MTLSWLLLNILVLNKHGCAGALSVLEFQVMPSPSGAVGDMSVSCCQKRKRRACGPCLPDRVPGPAGAINFKDVMIAYGKLPKDAMAAGFSEGKLGFEFAGLAPAPAGAPPRRVMGIAKQAIATRVDAPPYLVRARVGSCC